MGKFYSGKVSKRHKEAAAKNMKATEKFEIMEAIERQCLGKDGWPAMQDALEMAKIINLMGDIDR